MRVTLASFSGSLLPIFRPAAEELMRSSNLSPTDIIAKAIAKVAGHTQLRRRSLITGQDTFATMMLQIGKPMYSATFAFNSLRKVLSEDAVGKVKGMSLTKDNLGAVFDIPSELVDDFLAAPGGRLSITVLDNLPELQARPDRNTQGRGGGRAGRGGGGRGVGGRVGTMGNFSSGGAGRGAFGSPGSWPGRGAGGSGNSFIPGPGRGSGFGNPNTMPLGRAAVHGGHNNVPWRGGRGARGRGPNMR